MATVHLWIDPNDDAIRNLPPVCMKCGAPATTVQMKRFSWTATWIFLTKYQRVENRKERRGGTDPKRQRQNSDKRESGRFVKLTQREFEIVHVTRRVAPESDRRLRLVAPGRNMQATPREPEQLPL